MSFLWLRGYGWPGSCCCWQCEAADWPISPMALLFCSRLREAEYGPAAARVCLMEEDEVDDEEEEEEPAELCS